MTEITLDGIVGLDVTASEIRRQLAEAAGDVRLMIHSPGGSVFEGVAIHNALRDHRRAGHRVDATVTGIAASMATYIAMAAESVAVEDNAVFMVHNAHSLALGNRHALRQSADILESIDGVLQRAYQAKTGRDVTAEMDAETWYFGQEIVDAGFADRLIPAGEGAESKAEALALARGAFGHMTDKLRREAQPDLDQIAAMLPQQPKPEATMAKDPKAADAAEEQIPAQEPAEDAETEETPDTEARIQAAIAAERKRVSAIQARCAQVRMPELSAGLIESGASIAQANAAIVDAWVAQGGPEIRHAPDALAPTDFEAKVAEAVAAGSTRGQAIRTVAAAHPELHRQYLARVNRAA